MHTQMGTITEAIEVPTTIPEEGGAGNLCYAGIYGGTDAAAMMDRQKRVEGYKGRVNYRVCIPCERCTRCIELRNFSKGGEERLIGYVCVQMECETTASHTCDMAQLNRSGRKKVVFDTTNAPFGFKAGMASKTTPPESPKNRIEPDVPREGYRGGSNFYKRADGDREAVGSGKVPRGLVN